MNKFIGIGNLTREPELTTTTSGVQVARFGLAIGRKFANSDGERETDFLNCVAWREKAELLHKHCHKGDKIAVVGSVQVRQYSTQDGDKRTATEVVVDEINFLTPKGNNNAKMPNKVDMQPIGDDNLPF